MSVGDWSLQLWSSHLTECFWTGTRAKLLSPSLPCPFRSLQPPACAPLHVPQHLTAVWHAVYRSLLVWGLSLLYLLCWNISPVKVEISSVLCLYHWRVPGNMVDRKYLLNEWIKGWKNKISKICFKVKKARCSSILLYIHTYPCICTHVHVHTHTNAHTCRVLPETFLKDRQGADISGCPCEKDSRTVTGHYRWEGNLIFHTLH